MSPSFDQGELPVNAARIALALTVACLCLDVASVPRATAWESTMRARDSFSSGDLQWTFEYEFKVDGYGGSSSPPGGCGAETSSKPGACGFHRIFLEGTPHVTLSLIYKGKPYEYSADLKPGYKYSNFIPYSSYNVGFAVTLTAQIRANGPCKSSKGGILLLSTGEMDPGSGDFYIIPNRDAPLGSSVGVAIVVLVEYGGLIAEQSFRRGVEASPSQEVDIKVKQLEPNYDWVGLAGVMLLVLVPIIVLGIWFGRKRKPKGELSKSQQAAKIAVPGQYCMFCGTPVHGSTGFCPTCGRSQI